MKRPMIAWLVFTALTGILIISCGGAKTKLVETKVAPAYQGKPVSDILVIGVAHDEKSRRLFERRFVAQLKGVGLEAISSADVIPIPADQELEKEGILKAVAAFENDAVLVTFLVDIKNEEVRSPPMGSRGGYHAYYGHAYNYTHHPGYFRLDKKYYLETSLYDVKTEKRMWFGRSESGNPKSDKQFMNDVIKLVIEDLQRNGLLSSKS